MKTLLNKYCSETDAIAIYEIHKRAFLYSNETTTIDKLKKMMGFVLEEDERIVAYLMYSEYTKLCDDGSLWIYLDYVGTDPNFQGRGLGKTLMDRFVAYLDDVELPSLLHVEERTEMTDRLIEWYSKYGYTILRKHDETKKRKGVFYTLMVRIKK